MCQEQTIFRVANLTKCALETEKLCAEKIGYQLFKSWEGGKKYLNAKLAGKKYISLGGETNQCKMLPPPFSFM